MPYRARRHAALLAIAALLPLGAARAELGGELATVAADSGRMGARLTSTRTGDFTRHDLARANGGAVHELTNAAGQVFAVTWAGPGKPDLRALLGRHFAALQGAGAGPGAGIGRTMHALRRPPQVNNPDLKIQTEGHMGWFAGVAFVPSLAPPGFSADSLPRER